MKPCIALRCRPGCVNRVAGEPVSAKDGVDHVHRAFPGGDVLRVAGFRLS
jgi:hypothetical protein